MNEQTIRSTLPSHKISLRHREKITQYAGLIDRQSLTLRVSEETIRKIAEKHAPSQDLLKVLLWQALSEITFISQKSNFRTLHNAKACQAYCDMSLMEFSGINARQCWANWRTVPRNLNHRMPNRPLEIIDLCSGIGQSTQVLAYYTYPGSRILGLEFNPAFVSIARNKSFLDENGHSAKVAFHAQSVLETFHDEHGHRIADGTIDLINSCGAVGAHFDAQATRLLAEEIRRVLKPSGLTMIDSSSSGTNTQQVEEIFKSLGFCVLNRAKSCAFDRYTQVCFGLNS